LIAFRRDGSGRKTIGWIRPATTGNQLTDIDGLIRTKNDVVAAGTEGIAGFDRHQIAAWMANHLHTARDTPAMQVAIVQAILGDDVVVETIEVRFGQKLSREESGTTQAFEPSALRARRAWIRCAQGLAARGREVAVN